MRSESSPTSGSPDHDTRPVVDEDPAADLRAGVDPIPVSARDMVRDEPGQEAVEGGGRRLSSRPDGVETR